MAGISAGSKLTNTEWSSRLVPLILGSHKLPKCRKLINDIKWHCSWMHPNTWKKHTYSQTRFGCFHDRMCAICNGKQNPERLYLCSERQYWLNWRLQFASSLKRTMLKCMEANQRWVAHFVITGLPCMHPPTSHTCTKRVCAHLPCMCFACACAFCTCARPQNLLK